MTDFLRPGATGLSGAEPELGDAERVFRGLTPEVRSVTRYLLARTDRPVETPSAGLPESASLEVALAAQSAVREAIVEAGECGLPAPRRRALHGRLDRAFAKVIAELMERARRRARRVVRDVSHDLRSPLNSILLLADALASGRSGTLDEVQRRQVDVLYTATLSLVAWLTDLIDAASLEETDVVVILDEPFSVEAVLSQVDQLLRALADHGGVELLFRLETVGERRGDRRILSRVLLNLVANAIQATPRDGRVDVSATETRAGWLTVTVADSGTDADVEAIRRRIAERPLLTHRDDDRGWTHGLGLSICARLVAAAEGQLSVEGGGGERCRFTLDLPFPRAAPDGSSP